MSARQNYYEKLAQNKAFVAAAEAAAASGDMAEAKSQLDKAKAMESELDTLKAIMDEDAKYASDHAGRYGADRQDMVEMGRALVAGEAVKFDMQSLAKAGLLRTNSTTVATGSIVEPTGAGTVIRDALNPVPSLIDQVSSIDLTGMGAFEEPYVIAEQAAQADDIAASAGQARTATDPTFGKAKIAPYDVNVTSLVDHNLRRLSPAAYANKIQSMALAALRRKVNSLIVNGDTESSHVMFGITNAQNVAGANIFAPVALGSAIGVDTVSKLVYGYGGDEFVGGNARLLLTKANLQAIGALRGTNEKRKLFEIVPDAGNSNTGVIVDGGLIVPYTIVSAIGATTIAYGDPANYELGLFGDYSIRIDTSVKSIERMDAILGDIMVGGNLVVDKGFAVGTIA